MPWMQDIVDLVLGRACLGCGTCGPSLCTTCLAGLRAEGGTTRAARGVAGHATCLYRGQARRTVLDYKQHGDRSLARPLGRLLADAVTALGPPGSPRPLLVPVPSHRRSRRGFDALGDIADQAARALRADGLPARVERLLVTRVRYPPLKDLSRLERQRRVLGAFATVGQPPPRPVIVVDDVFTTGATIGEAIRALTSGGHRVIGFATVAAADRA